MPPIRASKKTSTAQRSTRQGRQRSPHLLTDEIKEIASSEDSSKEKSDHYQGKISKRAEPTSVETLMSQMVNTQRKRHAIKKQAIVKSYDASSTTLENSITTAFDEHEEKSTAAHEAQLKRLKALLAHKYHLETQMAQKLADLQASYDAHSRDLENVIKHRIKDLKST